MDAETTETTKYPAVKYDITEARVAELREKYEGLTIQGPTDKGGFDLVHEGRMVCKGIRVAIDKRRKHYNAEAIVFQRTVNSKAEETTAPVLLLETSLKAEENRIKKEIAEIKAAKIKEEEDRLQRRVDLLQRFGKQLSIVNLKAMSDDEFQAAYDEAKAEHEAEEARLALEEEEKAAQEEIERKEIEAKEEAERLEREANEEADRKKREALEEADRVEREAKEEEDRKALEAEEARLAEQRTEQDRIAKEQAEKEAENQAENDRLEAERQAIENDKKIEAAKKEEAERVRIEERERIQREAEEKAEDERKAKEEEARQEALKPDKEKLLAYADALGNRPLATPSLKDKKAQAIMIEALDMFLKVADFIRCEVEAM